MNSKFKISNKVKFIKYHHVSAPESIISIDVVYIVRETQAVYFRGKKRFYIYLKDIVWGFDEILLEKIEKSVGFIIE
jgi:hypothetical protein